MALLENQNYEHLIVSEELLVLLLSRVHIEDFVAWSNSLTRSLWSISVGFNAQEGRYAIVTDRWQKFSDVYLDEEVLGILASYADEFLVHGVDVEGKK